MTHFMRIPFSIMLTCLLLPLISFGQNCKQDGPAPDRDWIFFNAEMVSMEKISSDATSECHKVTWEIKRDSDDGITYYTVSDTHCTSKECEPKDCLGYFSRDEECLSLAYGCTVTIERLIAPPCYEPHLPTEDQ